MYGAIEAGGTKIVCAVSRSGYRPEKKLVLPTEAPDLVFPKILRFFAQETGPGGHLASLGIGSFGPINLDRKDPGYGTILATPKPGWEGVSYPDALALLKCPVVVSSDVNAAALAEAVAGSGRGRGKTAYVTVGTGLGVGFSDGSNAHNDENFEIGHIRVPRHAADEGFAGVCPYHGDCLEGLASGPAVLARWGRQLSELPQEHIALECEAHYLGNLAATLVLSHLPELIVFGGGVLGTQGLLDRIRSETVRLIGSYLRRPPWENGIDDYIVAPALGADAGIVGALLLAWRAAEQSS